MKVSRTSKVLLGGTVGYIFGWSTFYVLIMGWDYTYVEQYLAAGWTGTGFVKPMFIQGFGLLSGLVGAVLVFVVTMKRFSKDSGGDQ